MQLVTYKYRIKDKSAGKTLLRHAYAANQVWNWCVAQHCDVLDRYRAGAKPRRWLSHFDLTKTFKGFGKEIGLNQQTVQAICEQWVRSRSTTFRSSYGPKRAFGWIPFQKQSRQVEGNSILYLGKRYRFFGSKRRPLPDNAKGGCFVEDALGRWYVCFHVEIESRVNSRAHGEIGIDLGLKNFATLSDGQKIEMPRSYRQIEARLAIAQRAGNKRRAKALHTHAANVRRDFHHKLSTELAARYALIAVGDVSAKRLAKTRMAKSVLDAGWSAFRAMLAYKATNYREADEKFTTQTCSCCGSMSSDTRPKGIAGLGIRQWECSDCGAIHDRDVNAAQNILAAALSAQRPVEGSRESVAHA